MGMENESWSAEEKEKELAAIIADENLKDIEARKFVHNAFRDGSVKTTGADIDKILSPVSRFTASNERTAKRESVIEKILKFFEKFFGVA